MFIILSVVLSLRGPVLVDLLLVHFERLNHHCRIWVWTDTINVNLVFLDTVNKEVCWIQSNDSALIAVNFDGKNYSPQSLVDQAHQFREVAILHPGREAAAIDLVVHTLNVLGDPGLLLFTFVIIFIFTRTHNEITDEADDTWSEATLCQQGHLDLLHDDELVWSGRAVLSHR